MVVIIILENHSREMLLYQSTRITLHDIKQSSDGPDSLNGGGNKLRDLKIADLKSNA